MPTLYITEFADVHMAGAGKVGQIAIEPPLVEQTVAIGGASVQSNAFHPHTRLVRLHSDAVCSYQFGLSPNASTTTARMATNQTEYHGVPLGQGFKVAVISNT